MRIKKSVVLFSVLLIFSLFLVGPVFSAGLSKTPVDLDDVDDKDVDNQILRMGMIAELDAISLYEQLAAKAKNPHLKKVLLDIAREEKTHMGEFQGFLIELDPEYGPELEKGYEEIEELKQHQEAEKNV